MIDLESMSDEELFKLKSKIEEKLNKSCIYCGKQAMYLCDYIIGFNSSDGNLLKHFESLFTCDAPLCEKHRINKGHYHACGEESFSDTRDYCCSHSEFRGRFKPISIDEAKNIREGHYFKCHGARIL